MAFQSIFVDTKLPHDIVNIIEKDVEQFDAELSESKVKGGNKDNLNLKIRKSLNSWIPSSHWIGGFLWHYVMLANRTNFLYDLSFIDGGIIQYTQYHQGHYYGWHNDAGIIEMIKPKSFTNKCEARGDDFINKNIEMVRKLSFTVQLSDPDEYEGGNVQLLNETGKLYVAPRQRGQVIMFDSRTQHRVCKVRSGVRKSLVGWVVGPRWR
tara:strand:+ start:205 stop:831 length:627 start_codon:yes stop_codon:yes gene_type:complete